VSDGSNRLETFKPLDPSQTLGGFSKDPEKLQNLPKPSKSLDRPFKKIAVLSNRIFNSIA